MAGQVDALAFLREVDVQGLVDEYKRGDLSREDLVASLKPVAKQVNSSLHALAEHPEIGQATIELSDSAKQFATDRYLGGVSYSSFEEIPEVQRALDQVDFDIRADLAQGAR